MKLKGKTIARLLRGASVLACGGGLTYREQVKILRQLKKKTVVVIDLIDPNKVGEETVWLTVAELGPASAPPADKSPVAQLIHRWEKHTGIRVSGIIPGEIGQEMIVIETALKTGLAVVDSDLAGIRAVPRLQDLALVRQKVNFKMSPLGVLTSKGEILLISQQSSLAEEEKVLRKLAGKYPHQVVLFVGGAVTGKMIQAYLNYQSWSVAIKLGERLEQGVKWPKLLNNKLLVGPESLRVKQITKIEKSGFTYKRLKLENSDKEYTLEIENEFMKLTGKDVKIAFPDLINLLDPVKRMGLGSGELFQNQPVVLLAWQRFDCWR